MCNRAVARALVGAAPRLVSYRDAMAELQEILDRLRNTEDVDVDELVKDVARAKELLDFCGGKIKRADAAIKTIVAELQAGQPPPGPAESSPNGVE